MFLNNKYTNWYYNIIKNAQCQERKKSQDTYFEKHHIIPRSLGGNNRKENIVLLTAREHLICHWLLTKMILDRNKYKMFNAFFCMSMKCKNTYERYTNSRLHAIARKKRSEVQKDRFSNPKNNPMFKKNHSEESKRRMSINSKGLTLGERNGMFGKSRQDTIERNKIKKYWITNGVVNKLIPQIDLNVYSQQGFVRGRS